MRGFMRQAVPRPLCDILARVGREGEELLLHPLGRVSPPTRSLVPDEATMIRLSLAVRVSQAVEIIV